MKFIVHPIQKDEQYESGCFIPPETPSWIKCEEEFDRILDNNSTISSHISFLQDIIGHEPDFLDAFAHIGSAYFNNGSVEEALAWYQKGLDIALPLIPPGFSGAIPWLDLSNRPFLRLHHGYLLCHLKLRQYKKAVKLMEEHLQWNENDNIGVRYLIGDAYLQAGMPAKARKALKDSAKSFPPNAYSLGLLEFKQKHYVEAATSLRYGFASNQYIAEFLLGNMEPKKHFFWHSTNLQYPELAQEYLDSECLKLWYETDGAINFVNWLFNCAVVLKERAMITEAREGLTYERDITTRGKHSDNLQKILNNIDDSTSKPLIRKVTDRHNTEYWPWQHGR